MGTEDNGLRASAYTPLGRLDAGTAAEALDTLRDAGVAAYVEPVRDDTPPGDAPDAPPDETGADEEGRGGAGVIGDDRRVLWVDAAAAERARALLAPGAPSSRPDAPDERGPGTAGADRGDTVDDSVWEALVAAYDAPSAGGARPWPASEDLPDAPDEAAGAEGDVAEGTRAEDTGGPAPDASASPRRRRGDVPPQAPHAEDDDDHFVPPVPPPPPKGDPVTRWAWSGVLGGPVFLFATALVGVELPGWLALLVVGGFVAGFVTLVARMRDDPPRDSGGDDGAVV